MTQLCHIRFDRRNFIGSLDINESGLCVCVIWPGDHVCIEQGCYRLLGLEAVGVAGCWCDRLLVLEATVAQLRVWSAERAVMKNPSLRCTSALQRPCPPPSPQSASAVKYGQGIAPTAWGGGLSPSSYLIYLISQLKKNLSSHSKATRMNAANKIRTGR